MAQLTAREGVAAKALMFAILTAARAGEVLGATWNEIDFENAVWILPPSRMKGRREHRVPLAPQAVELLKAFIARTKTRTYSLDPRSGAGLSETALAAVMRRVGRTETVHGLRSSFSDWAHERSAFNNHEIETALAHKVGSEVERAYRRGDLLEKRRKLMEAWAKYCDEPASGREDRHTAAPRLTCSDQRPRC